MRLKTMIRKGWERWNISALRVESVAEHIYGTMMLAIAMHSEFYKEINIDKVIKMLAIHEMEEIRIGDITPFDNVEVEEKRTMGKKAVQKLCNNIELGYEYEKLIEEFENGETKEAKFAKMCDKFEADLQSKVYDESKCFDLTSDKNKNNLEDSRIKNMTNKGINTVSGYFIGNDYNKYDAIFKNMADYLKDNNIGDFGVIKQEDFI